MKRKATRGLTKAGKRRGRPPKYLTHVDLNHPTHRLEPPSEREPAQLKSDTPFIIRMILAKHQALFRLKKDLANRLDAEDKRSGHTREEIEAVAARIRRLSGDGVDKVRPTAGNKRRVSLKNEQS